MPTTAQSELMGSVIGALVYSTASPGAASVRTTVEPVTFFIYSTHSVPIFRRRPKVVGLPCVRVSSIARTNSACAICNSRALLCLAAAKDTTTTAAFMPHCVPLDILGSCMYVAMF